MTILGEGNGEADQLVGGAKDYRREEAVFGFATSGTGLVQIMDDHLRELHGKRGRKVFREMRDNDPIIGGVLSAISQVMKSTDWRAEPAEADVTGEYAEFAEDAILHIDGGFSEFVGEFAEVLVYGFGIYEILLTQRPEDGRYITDKLSPRQQETIYEWDLDEKDRVKGVWQQTENKFGKFYLPRHKFLHLRTQQNRGNPEGRSILRNAYKSYYYIKTLQQVEAIAAEREMTGMPVVYAPSEALKNEAQKTALLKLVSDLKFNEQGGAVLPSDMYLDSDGNPTGERKYDFKLLAADGSRNIDIGAIIRRHQQDMTISALADFLLMGQSGTGSFALAKEKSSIFLQGIYGYMNAIKSAINQHLVSLIWQINGLPAEMKPEINYGEIAPVNLAELGAYIRDLSGAGIQLGGDVDLENELRNAAGLPQVAEDAAGALNGSIA